ncbi:MAG TPA: tRNA (adenosine(37)-N6)-dimethylallyltransferase MiaA [bacterium]|nr:tRNA (adenosine(37)-N6)-dimethylallyltransferase MiaA [bacterium]
MQKIVIICGPTGVGKTAAAVFLAKRARGEIVSADSQQVWRRFDVGTAKPSREECGEVAHHLIDVADPGDEFDAARFVALADEAIRGIAARGRVPFVVGGTGMYIKMLVHGICEAPPRDPEVRGELEAEIERRGLPALHAELAALDPGSAATLAPGDRTRIVRALEIFRITGVPASALRQQHGFKERRYDALKIGLDLEREELYRRIEARVDLMISAGLVEEARSLVAKHGAACRPFAAVGYREMASHIAGETTLEEAIRLIKQHTRNFAKRQLTWFRADPEIRWFSPKDLGAIEAAICQFLH